MTSFALENNYEKTSGAFSFFYNWGKHFWINDGYAVGGEPLDYRFNSRDDMLGLSWYSELYNSLKETVSQQESNSIHFERGVPGINL